MSVLRFPDRPRKGGVYRSGRTDGGSDIMVARDDDGTYLGELIVGPHMSRAFSGEMLERHRLAWQGRAGPRVRERRKRIVPAAVVAAAVALIFAPLASRLGADHGEILLEPTTASGFDITYTPPSTIRGDEISIAGWFRTGAHSWHDGPRMGEPFRARLIRVGRAYHGSVTLPPDAIYAAFWAESPSGRDDSEGGLYHFSTGSIAAEMDRLRVVEHQAGLGEAGWSEYLAVADELKQRFPDDPEVAANRLFRMRELGLIDRTAIRSEFERLHRRLTPADAGRRQTEAMVALGGLAGEMEGRSVWVDRIWAAYPGSRTARTLRFEEASANGPEAVLAVADSLWAANGSLDHDHAIIASQIAASLGGESLIRWGERVNIDVRADARKP